ncbi:alpha/beta hydrolase [Actinotalea sp. K2]|uniref:alpha/beta hydrolase n=1 Tax=Actinotalea sp. K2 TaxID=2939438 RepID=UPI002016E62F|nr:alpha/beta hydrolase [Actinotalea sp. K2]MCL3862120.1 alpha/beta hydrolase [Actinotalea sp. K2]
MTAVGRTLVLTTMMAGMSVAAPAMSKDLESVPPTVAWGTCPQDVAAVAPLLECGLLAVPLDYDDPDGVQIELMLSRQVSTAPDRRRGVLLLNPGGPGGTAGLAMPADLVARGIPANVTDAFDLIGMDTRGVRYSSPVSCGFTDEQDYRGAVPPYAVDDDAVLEQAEAARTVAEQCAANDIDGYLRHLSTANMARDLDRIRIALGEETISYYGVSYGTALGAAYASMFPEHSDRIVLDSNIGDTHLDRDGLRRYALGVEDTFPDFADWAAARHDSYGLGRSSAEVRATYLELAERFDEEPLGDGFDGAWFRFMTFVTLYEQTGYAPLAHLWQSLLGSDTTAVTVAEQLERNGTTDAPADPPPLPDGLSAFDNSWSVLLAVTCNDVKWAEDVETYQQAVAEDRQRYPLFGAASANITPCAFWPHAPGEPPVAVDDDGPRNILILQNHHDPVTPHLGGVLLREKFDQRSRLVTVQDSGHGVFVYRQNACATNITTSFLVDGTMPARDTRCPA